MASYLMLGTNDIEKSSKFYKTILQDAGLKDAFSHPHCVVYNLDGFLFGVVKPRNGSPATYGNGTMVALEVGSPEMVEKVVKKALAEGAKMDGVLSKNTNDAGEIQFYGQYMRDLDNNRICITANKM